MASTFPRLLQEHAKLRPRATAMREKEYGVWQTWNWQRALDAVRDMTLGLEAIGFQAGDNPAVVGDNRPRLYLMFIAVQAIGGVPVPMYQDSVTDEMGSVLLYEIGRGSFRETLCRYV